MSWILTHSGRRFDYDNPTEICLNDIARALSMQCRFNGHVAFFYSVAQHSVLVSKLVPEEFALEALMHDATEAYVGDVPKPFKDDHLADFEEQENRIYSFIAEKYGLNKELSDATKLADKQALMIEARVLYKELPDDWGYPDLEVPDLKIRPMVPFEAEKAFRERYGELLLAKYADA